jgi:hypothetical protein
VPQGALERPGWQVAEALLEHEERLAYCIDQTPFALCFPTLRQSFTLVEIMSVPAY